MGESAFIVNNAFLDFIIMPEKAKSTQSNRGRSKSKTAKGKKGSKSKSKARSKSKKSKKTEKIPIDINSDAARENLVCIAHNIQDAYLHRGIAWKPKKKKGKK